MKGTFRELSHYLGNSNTMLFREDRFEKKYCFPSDGVQEITKENATSKYLKHIFEKEKCENIEDIYIFFDTVLAFRFLFLALQVIYKNLIYLQVM